MDEIFDVVDEQGRTISKATRPECHSNRELLHPVVHLHIFDSRGRIFLQKRALSKNLLPGYWDAGVGGHVDSGENPEAALIRETREEIGVDARQARFLYHYIWESPREREFVYAYMLIYEGPMNLDPLEVADGRYFSLEEVNLLISKDTVTPNFEFELRNYLLNEIKKGN